jgi:hypothetical protein
LLFSTGALEVNLWGNGPNSPYTLYTGLTVGNYPIADALVISFQADSSPVPEPGSILLLGTGLACLGLFAFRRSRLQDAPENLHIFTVLYRKFLPMLCKSISCGC